MLSTYVLLVGLFFVLPCIETYTKVDLRTITLDVPPQEVVPGVHDLGIMMLDVGFFSMLCCQNGCEVLSIRGMNGRSGILDPMKFW